VSWTVRPASRAEADLAAIAAVVNAATPDDPASVEEMRWADATYPGTDRFLVEEEGRAVGAATVGRIYMYPAEFDGLWATIAVLAEARGRGAGSALWRAVSRSARKAGKTALHVPASEARPEGISFLVHRGFRESERQKVVRLALAGLHPPEVDPPPGISIVSLARRPDLVPGVYAVALETFPDIPGGEEEMAAGTLEMFRARDIERPGVAADGFQVAVDTASGVVAGYSSVLIPPGQASVAWHDMTAVQRSWRGRGIAMALKRAVINWAIETGIEALDTGNDMQNEQMRAVNARLGYQPMPDAIIFRGPLAPA
jgi:mycothiol synthase